MSATRTCAPDEVSSRLLFNALRRTSTILRSATGNGDDFAMNVNPHVTRATSSALQNLGCKHAIKTGMKMRLNVAAPVALRSARRTAISNNSRFNVGPSAFKQALGALTARRTSGTIMSMMSRREATPHAVTTKEDKHIATSISSFAASGLPPTYDSTSGHISPRTRCATVGETPLSASSAIIILAARDSCAVRKFPRTIAALRISVENNTESRTAEAAIGFGESINSFTTSRASTGMRFSQYFRDLKSTCVRSMSSNKPSLIDFIGDLLKRPLTDDGVSSLCAGHGAPAYMAPNTRPSARRSFSWTFRSDGSVILMIVSTASHRSSSVFTAGTARGISPALRFGCGA
mmetsp:Transcript_2449/g.9564  ORF Transcript_2449/g.9564 Transcript_2449/m.9564 type:complete len:348 (-) Transcript_2449:1591-2634(-)